MLGWVGLRAARHLPPAGVESHYHLPGQRVQETSLGFWSEAPHWLQSPCLGWAEAVVNQGSVFSELSSRLIPVATLAGARGHGLSCRPSSQVQLTLPPGNSALPRQLGAIDVPWHWAQGLNGEQAPKCLPNAAQLLQRPDG